MDPSIKRLMNSLNTSCKFIKPTKGQNRLTDWIEAEFNRMWGIPYLDWESNPLTTPSLKAEIEDYLKTIKWDKIQSNWCIIKYAYPICCGGRVKFKITYEKINHSLHYDPYTDWVDSR